MSTLTTPDALAESLVRLEGQLELPHVPGELDKWGEEVCKQLVKVSTCLRSTVALENPSAFLNILKNDLELAKRVEQMKLEDEQLLVALEAVQRQAEELNRIVDEGCTAEDQFQPKRNRLVEDGLKLVIRVRKQKSAVDTWMGESMRRDSGSGD